MKRFSCLLLILLSFCLPDTAFSAITLDNRIGVDSATKRAFVTRLEEALTQTDKRIREVFGITVEVKAVLGPSKEGYDLRLATQDSSDGSVRSGDLLINSRIARNYPARDLDIAAGRALHETVWRKFRKAYTPDSVLLDKLYRAGMTAYAADLLFPGAPPWKYAGLIAVDGSGHFVQYLNKEKKLAAEVRQALGTPAESELAARLFPEGSAADPGAIFDGRMLSYRIIKSCEKEIDPKMIQLMEYKEFSERFSRSVEVLLKRREPDEFDQ